MLFLFWSATAGYFLFPGLVSALPHLVPGSGLDLDRTNIKLSYIALVKNDMGQNKEQMSYTKTTKVINARNENH